MPHLETTDGVGYDVYLNDERMTFRDGGDRTEFEIVQDGGVTAVYVVIGPNEVRIPSGERWDDATEAFITDGEPIEFTLASDVVASKEVIKFAAKNKALMLEFRQVQEVPA